MTAEDRCQVWLGPQPGTATEPGSFSSKQIGHFLLRGPGGASCELFPFLCYLPDSEQENRLHFYDSLYRYKSSFSYRSHPFFTRRWLLRPDIYQSLCEEKARSDRQNSLRCTAPEYFPAYRAPAVPALGDPDAMTLQGSNT